MRSRQVLASLVAFVTTCSYAVAQPPPTPAKPNLADDFKLLAEIFEPPGVPSIHGKSWKIADVGPKNWAQSTEGWVLEESARQVVLRTWSGEVERLSLPQAGANRPLLKMNPDGSINGAEFEFADYSVAWGLKDGNYLAKSKEFLAAGLPGKEKDEGGFGFRSEFNLIGNILSSARYAHYAQQLGEHEHAAALHALSLQGYTEYGQGYILGMPPDESWQKFIAEQTARGLRNYAVHQGHDGAARKELHELWVRIAAIPRHSYRDEARDMEKQYARLLEEDKLWKEPDSKTLAQMSTEEKVKYWLYHLRDLDVGQHSDPGSCHVLGDFGSGFRKGDKQRPHPAEELKKLGIAAVPQLIDHLGDSRPTRCKEHWRSYWPDGHHLLRYGDCCQQILDEITKGEMFSYETRRTYPIAADAQQRAKEKFAAWQRKSEGRK